MSYKVKIISNDKSCANNMLLRVRAPEIALKATPGQFVNVLCSPDNKLILRRPFSIMNTDATEGIVDIAYEIRGEGTKLLSNRSPGETLDIMGPLGNGFLIDKNFNKIAVVGGGIGVYPLYFLAKEYEGCSIDVFLGYQCADKIVLMDEFDIEGCSIFLSTDDGSIGQKGYITDLFMKKYEKGSYDMVFICGPEIMAKKIVKKVNEEDGRCQVSLEERMGCGIGACLVCSCEVKTSGCVERRTVCKDGPVFDGSVVFQEV